MNAMLAGYCCAGDADWDRLARVLTGLREQTQALLERLQASNIAVLAMLAGIGWPEC